MEAIILTTQQLETLKKFIISKGIRETDVINEILDHFACKTEEILNNSGNITFEKAITLAHKSFGRSGFRSVVAQYEKSIEKMAWTDYKSSIKDAVKSPSILFILSCSLLFYTLVSHVPVFLKAHWLLGIRFWTIIICSLTYITTKTLFLRKIKRNYGINLFKADKLNLWQKKIFSTNTNGLLILNFTLIILPHTNNEPSDFLLIYCSIIAFLSLLGSVVQYKSLQKMTNRFKQTLSFS
ncbi:MAG: hypothetical protein WC716_10915 [Chitinophagaceae bacterium]|jgi:hypothetical protein